jgi:hypothetical protein
LSVAGTFRVLEARVPADREEWIRRWRAWPDNEVWGHPALAELFAGPGERVLCATSASEEGGILFPLLLRPLAALEWVEPGEMDADVTSPYGYGGPFRWGAAAEDAYWDAFEAWAQRARVVSCFTRLSLFRNQRAAFRGEERTVAPNVVRDLRAGADAIWRNYEHKVRKNVNRATREGLRLEIDPDGRRMKDFLYISRATRRRRSATEAYAFGREFFETLVQALAPHTTWVHAIWQDRVVSTELLLVSATRLYSFLGGTREEAFAVRPNDFLKHGIILWGQSRGLADYVLGGGFEPGDGIFEYKKSFAPDGVVPFAVGTRVFDGPAHARLVKRREAWENARGRPWHPRAGFFPEYRS